MDHLKSPPQPVKGNALSQDESSIRQRLKVLSQEFSSQHADPLELLVRFDDLQGWKATRVADIDNEKTLCHAAVVLMAEASLQYAGRAIATADSQNAPPYTAQAPSPEKPQDALPAIAPSQ